VFIPLGSPLLQQVLANMHDAGHEGAEKTLHHFCVDFHMPNMCGTVREFVHASVTCQRNKTELLHPARLLQLLEVATTIWVDVTLDFIKGFPCINGKWVVLTVVDMFSKATHFLPLGHPYMATTMVHTFFNNVVKLHGVSSSVFTGHFWLELFLLADVKLQMSSAFHPQ
jgi:hypothetical protein